jgi:hypothetical protein
MVRLILSEDQQRLVETATGTVSVYGRDGSCLGVIQRIDSDGERILEAMRRLASGSLDVQPPKFSNG